MRGKSSVIDIPASDRSHLPRELPRREPVASSVGQLRPIAFDGLPRDVVKCNIIPETRESRGASDARSECTARMMLPSDSWAARTYGN